MLAVKMTICVNSAHIPPVAHLECVRFYHSQWLGFCQDPGEGLCSPMGGLSLHIGGPVVLRLCGD